MNGTDTTSDNSDLDDLDRLDASEIPYRGFGCIQGDQYARLYYMALGFTGACPIDTDIPPGNYAIELWQHLHKLDPAGFRFPAPDLAGALIQIANDMPDGWGVAIPQEHPYWQSWLDNAEYMIRLNSDNRKPGPRGWRYTNQAGQVRYWVPGLDAYCSIVDPGEE